MSINFENAFKQFSGVAEKAARGAGKLAQKGKETLDYKAVERELAAQQRQLGALAYESLRKGEALQPEEAEKYIKKINRLKNDLEELRPQSASSTVVCKKCGACVREGAMFCSSCGAKLG